MLFSLIISLRFISNVIDCVRLKSVGIMFYKIFSVSENLMHSGVVTLWF